MRVFSREVHVIVSLQAKHIKTGEERVIKAVKKSRTALPLDEIEQEILIMRPEIQYRFSPLSNLVGCLPGLQRRQIDHPNIVRLFEWYEDGNRIYLVLDYLKGGSLKDVVLQLNKKARAGLALSFPHLRHARTREASKRPGSGRSSSSLLGAWLTVMRFV